MELILQGLTKRTHAEVLGEMFSGNVARSIISVAFVSQDAVDYMVPTLVPHAATVTVFAGIRNEITSSQALKRLLEIGVSLYAVDTGTRTLLFHPKLYLVRKVDAAQLLVGSANLTLGGLNNNVEASVLLSLPLDENGSAFVAKTEASLDGLAAEHPENVFQITSPAMIDALLNAGRLVDESATPPPEKPTRAKSGSSDPTPRMKMQTKPLRGRTRATAAAGGSQSTPAAAGPGPSVVTSGVSVTLPPDLELVWESKPLRRRSLGIPTGATSNPTGAATLGSGTFTHIDRVTYFRNDLFGHLTWILDGSMETATQEFDLVIKGVLVGTFDLTLRHSRTREAAAEEDKNSPTSLSWNAARPLVAREDLLGRTMRIWRAATAPPEFRIEID